MLLAIECMQKKVHPRSGIYDPRGTLNGSFSVVSKPIFASEYSLEKRKLLTISTRFTHFCTAPHSKILLNFVKHFHMFAVLFSKYFFAILIFLNHQFRYIFEIPAICAETIKFPGISKRILFKFSENELQKVRQIKEDDRR